MRSSIQGVVGAVEIKELAPASGLFKAVAVLSHPHPLYGGTMNNKVITTAAKACGLSDIVAISHNFRGVGKTAGVHAKGVGELEDTLAVINYAKQRYPNVPVVLIGFSFGAAVTIQAAGFYPDALMIAIAPPVYPAVLAVREIKNSWYVFMGDADEVVSVDEVREWLKDQKNQAIEHWFEGGSHFFHGQLIELRTSLVNVLKNTVN